MSTLATKVPVEIKKYTFDLTSWLDKLGLTITSIVSVIADSGLTVDSSALDATNKKITVTLSGGTAGTAYKVRATFQTGDGQTLTADIFVPVENIKG